MTKSDDNVMNANTLINETNTLRDELLVAVAKLEQYAENLRHEAIRLKNVANREGDKRA